LNTFSIDENWSRISENKKKSKSQIMAMGKMVRDSREKKCMPCVVARIYIVLLVVLERGVRVRRNCNIFNLAMENVLKRCGAVRQCLTPAHKVFRDRMTETG
jgi:hypothetical protein